MVLPAREAVSLPRDRSQRFRFQVPEHWRPRSVNPHAAEAAREVLDWFAGLGCTLPELARARKFDVAGYVGIPFPNLSQERTVLTAKYLSLWLLWDDVRVERLSGVWRVDAESLFSGRAPADMTRFDLGWWQIFRELAESRSPAWMESLCAAMATWGDAAAREASWMRRYRDHGMSPDLETQMEMRIATIGMYATVYLLEDGYGFELPRAFHEDPTARRLKWLSSQIVGIGNDVFSFGKDAAEDQPNLVTTLMREAGVGADEALERLIAAHDGALHEFDRLASSLPSWGPAVDAVIDRWLADVRYASLGFTLWESQAPRYTAHKVVVDGRVVEPGICFVPRSPVREVGPSSRGAGPSSSRGTAPLSQRGAAPSSSRGAPSSVRTVSGTQPRVR